MSGAEAISLELEKDAAAASPDRGDCPISGIRNGADVNAVNQPRPVRRSSPPLSERSFGLGAANRRTHRIEVVSRNRRSAGSRQRALQEVHGFDEDRLPPPAPSPKKQADHPIASLHCIAAWPLHHRPTSLSGLDSGRLSLDISLSISLMMSAPVEAANPLGLGGLRARVDHEDLVGPCIGRRSRLTLLLPILMERVWELGPAAPTALSPKSLMTTSSSPSCGRHRPVALALREAARRRCRSSELDGRYAVSTCPHGLSGTSADLVAGATEH